MIDLLPLTDNAPYFDDAVAVYTDYVPSEAVNHHARFFRSHMQRPDYHGLVARLTQTQKVVGIAFGSACLPGQWWHDKVAAQTGADHPALQQAWTLTQLNVLKEHRNQGIGERLHHAIIERQPCRKLLLSTQLHNRGAQRFYRRHGWHILHPGFVFSQGDVPYMIMYRWLNTSAR
jgi:hypothetical protein